MSSKLLFYINVYPQGDY